MFKQAELNYKFNALEPYIDELTMITHYSKHHAAYTNNLNSALANLPELLDKSIEEVFLYLPELSDQTLKTAITNNGGGYYNHNLYFTTLSPEGGHKPGGRLAEEINKGFGSFDELKSKLSAAAISRFGSGWAWLSADKNGNLKVSSTPNQDNPFIESHGEWVPILGIDVWEHAYYLKYKNLRADYINSFFEVVDWNAVTEYYNKARS